jgi:hypothetical protein
MAAGEAVQGSQLSSRSTLRRERVPRRATRMERGAGVSSSHILAGTSPRRSGTGSPAAAICGARRGGLIWPQLPTRRAGCHGLDWPRPDRDHRRSGDHGKGRRVGSRVELFADIRRDARVEECSIRELADRYHVHRRTVRQALASAVPPPRKTPARMSPRLAPFQAAIDGMLRADLEAPRKRHTARRVLVPAGQAVASASPGCTSSPTCSRPGPALPRRRRHMSTRTNHSTPTPSM